MPRECKNCGKPIKNPLYCNQSCHYEHVEKMTALLTEKRCGACKRILPIESFAIKYKNKPLRMCYCHDCNLVLMATRYKKRGKVYKTKHRSKPDLFKQRMRSRLRYAIAHGKLVRKSCEVCGKKSEAHHDDYSKPLEVRWLCRQHHAALHRGEYKAPIVEATVLNQEHNELKRV